MTKASTARVPNKITYQEGIRYRHFSFDHSRLLQEEEWREDPGNSTRGKTFLMTKWLWGNSYQNAGKSLFWSTPNLSLWEKSQNKNSNENSCSKTTRVMKKPNFTLKYSIPAGIPRNRNNNKKKKQLNSNSRYKKKETRVQLTLQAWRWLHAPQHGSDIPMLGLLVNSRCWCHCNRSRQTTLPTGLPASSWTSHTCIQQTEIQITPFVSHLTDQSITLEINFTKLPCSNKNIKTVKIHVSTQQKRAQILLYHIRNYQVILFHIK